MSGSQLLLLGGTPQVASDPNFEYTTLLLPGNGTNGAQNNTFLDSSTNNFTITRNGNTTQGTFSPFSQTGWGNYFDGSGDYLQLADSTAWDLAGDFTIEMSLYKTSTTSQTFFMLGAGGSTSILMYQNASNVIIFLTSSAVITASTAAQLNAWNHVALVRSGSTITLYLNGTNVGQATNATSFTGDAANGVRIGAEYPTGFEFTGYISNLRIVKGTAVYTSNFTPPTAPLTAITNTSLLTCQSNRFIDNSTNAFAITRNGDVSVQAFSPFNPTAAWSASTNGGSGYFDGSGDYLATSTSSSAFAIGTGQFTVEAWVYTSDTVWMLVSSTTLGGLGFGYNVDNGSQGLGIWRVGVGPAVTSGVQIPYNAWTHIAVSRDSSNNVRFYANGVQIGSTTNSTADFGTVDQVFQVGTDRVVTQFLFTGYAASVRVIKGAAQYTGSTYTVPTAPLTAITNTSLLLNYTNAGIYDATSKNDLETVGNAQISTTQSKFGGSSMLFDGTGDWLALPASQNFAFGTGDFTIEGWLYASALGSVNAHGVFQQGTSLFPASVSNSLALGVNPSGTLVIYAKNTNTNSTATVSTGLWAHFALVRFGTTTVLYANGTAVITVTSDSTNYTGTFFGVGSIFGTSGTNWNGYIDDLRITKGVARYTASFTAPTAAFPLL